MEMEMAPEYCVRKLPDLKQAGGPCRRKRRLRKSFIHASFHALLPLFHLHRQTRAHVAQWYGSTRYDNAMNMHSLTGNGSTIEASKR